MHQLQIDYTILLRNFGGGHFETVLGNCALLPLSLKMSLLMTNIFLHLIHNSIVSKTHLNLFLSLLSVKIYKLFRTRTIFSFSE